MRPGMSPHKLSSNSAVLHFGINGDRPNSGDRRSLIDAIAADDPASNFSDYTIKPGMGKHHRNYSCGTFRFWKIARKTVALTYGVECVIADLSANGRVLRPCLTDRHFIPGLVGQHFLASHLDSQFILSRIAEMTKDPVGQYLAGLRHPKDSTCE